MSGLSSDEAVQKFLKAVPLVEKAIVGSGILLIKYWLEVSEAVQIGRLASRIDDAAPIASRTIRSSSSRNGLMPTQRPLRSDTPAAAYLRRYVAVL